MKYALWKLKEIFGWKRLHMILSRVCVEFLCYFMQKSLLESLSQAYLNVAFFAAFIFWWHLSTPRKIKHHSIYINWLPLRPFFFSCIPQNNTSMLSCFCLLLFSIQESRLITARYWMTTRCMRKLERGALAPSIWRPIARQTYNMPSSSWTWHRHVSKIVERKNQKLGRKNW